MAQGDGSNKNNGEQQTKEVTWIDLKEPEQQKEVSYTVPAGVSYPYHIKVNRAANCVTVYGIDESGSYSIPVKAFAASCGRAGEETITGENYKTSDMYVWRLMVDNTYGHYAYRISGGYLFHSVPYLKAANNTLETEEYNKLGTFASLAVSECASVMYCGCMKTVRREQRLIFMMMLRIRVRLASRNLLKFR